MLGRGQEITKVANFDHLSPRRADRRIARTARGTGLRTAHEAGFGRRVKGRGHGAGCGACASAR
jgi:hypothetical protein